MAGPEPFWCHLALIAESSKKPCSSHSSCGAPTSRIPTRWLARCPCAAPAAWPNMDPFLVSSLLLSGVIGLSLGIFGGGGSILAVPVLVLVTQLAPASAVGTSLAMVGTTSLIASYAHHRRGQVKFNVALLFGLSGVVTAFLGAKLTGLVSGSVIMRAFAALMLLVGVGMLFSKGRMGTAK